MVTAIVVKDGDNYVFGEMFVLGEGLKTSEQMRKYRHVSYQSGLYYDKKAKLVIDQNAILREKVYLDAIRTNIKEEILNQNPFVKALRRGR